MAIGERIRFFRNLRGMTQRYLGMLLGFPERSSDVRVAQYESGTRTPKQNVIEELAYHLQVAPEALNVPDIDHNLGLMHTLFALEDLKGLTIDKIDGEVVLKVDKSDLNRYISMHSLLDPWQEQAAKLRSGEITKEEYDKWRYNYPAYAGLPWVKNIPEIR